MKTAGIIVEYNPFHNGHKFHIEETRRITGADFVIAVMSGNFVQRGACALLDKYVRTQMALSCGVDLVLELPVFFAAGSAGDFSAGAVSLLDKLGVVDALCFGSECGHIKTLQSAAAILAKEPPEFSGFLQARLRQGFSFPSARAAALKACLAGVSLSGSACQADSADAPDPALQERLPVTDEFFLAPNNILGIEYCAALLRRNSAIRPFTISRKDAGYLEDALPPAAGQNAFPSALSLRKALYSASRPLQLWPRISPLVPGELSGLWQTLLSENSFLFPRDFTQQLRYRLILDSSVGFEQYADVSRELSDKLKKSALRFTDWDSLCALLHSKETTYSRISRSLCHILLSITKDEVSAARQNDYTPYARILGFQKSAAPLLSAIRHNSSVPLVSKLADAHRLLPPPAFSMLQKDILAAHLYEAARFSKTGKMPVNEYTRQIILL